MIDRAPIYVLLAGCALLGAVVFAELGPDREDSPAIETPARSAAPPPEQRQARTGADELVAEALARPLFSSTRRPPAAAAGDDGPTGGELSDTRLAGIVTEPGRRFAIFVPEGAKPLTVIEGETVSGWRVDSITPREVSLSGPGGNKTLQPKIDPNLTPPAPPSPPAAAAPAATPPAAAARARSRAAAQAPPGLPVPPPRPGVQRRQR